jgi:hypothetical protein
MLDQSTTSLQSSIPQSKNKKKKKKNRRKDNSSPGRSLTIKELSEHVSGNYINGRNGPMNGKTRNRGVFDNEQDKSRADFLKKLNARPALVLNADYQVRNHSEFTKLK